MPFIRIALILILLVGSHSHAQQPTVDFSRLESSMAAAMRDWEIPGMAAAIVQNDSVVYARGFGVCTMGKDDPVDVHTLFAIASLSKAFTSASLAMLVDQGRIAWDDKVTQYIPHFQMHDPYATREMTIRDLLSHRSGLHTYGGDLIWYGTNYSREEVIRRVRHLKPRFSFRANYGYQNIMFLAAGEIIPAVTGRSWDEFVRDSLLLPLGMTETNTSVKRLSGRSNVATPHTHHKGKLITVPYRDVDNVGGAAAVNSNVHDLSRWLRMWLRDDATSGAGRLSASAKHELWSPQTVVPLSQSALRTIPSRHFNASGLGWFTFDYHGRKVLTHGGGMDGMISRIVLVPEMRLGFIILTNSINSLPTSLMYRILDAFFANPERDWNGEALARKAEGERKEQEAHAKAERERAKNTKPSLALSGYTGSYWSEMYGDVRVELERGKLVVRFVPTATYVADLTHWHYDTFEIEMRDPTLPTGMATFVLDAAGKPSELRIDIPNPDFDFTELELRRVE